MTEQRIERLTILWAYLGAAVLHLILNLPAVLYQFGWVSVELESLGLVILFIGLADIFERLRRVVSSPTMAADRNAVVYFRRQVESGPALGLRMPRCMVGGT